MNGRISNSPPSIRKKIETAKQIGAKNGIKIYKNEEPTGKNKKTKKNGAKEYKIIKTKTFFFVIFKKLLTSIFLLFIYYFAFPYS